MEVFKGRPIPIRVVKDSIKYEGTIILIGNAFCIIELLSDGVELDSDMIGYSVANDLISEEYTNLAKQYGPSLSGRAS